MLIVHVAGKPPTVFDRLAPAESTSPTSGGV
jgi:hypothetical protein